MTKSFKDMLCALEQYRNGLLSEAELILALQCDTHQVTALIQFNKLPPAASANCSIAMWDDEVEKARTLAGEQHGS